MTATKLIEYSEQVDEDEEDEDDVPLMLSANRRRFARERIMYSVLLSCFSDLTERCDCSEKESEDEEDGDARYDIPEEKGCLPEKPTMYDRPMIKMRIRLTILDIRDQVNGSHDKLDDRDGNPETRVPEPRKPCPSLSSTTAAATLYPHGLQPYPFPNEQLPRPAEQPNHFAASLIVVARSARSAGLENMSSARGMLQTERTAIERELDELERQVGEKKQRLKDLNQALEVAAALSSMPAARTS